MGKRVISSVVVVAFTTIMLIMGGWFMLICLAGLSFGGMYEIFRLARKDEKEMDGRFAFKVMMIDGMVAAVVWMLLVHTLRDNIMNGNLTIMFLLTLVIVLMFEVVILYPRFTYVDMAFTLFGVMYVGVLFSTFYMIRTNTNGEFYVWYIFAVAWGSDTCAFFTGLSLGRHKMSPLLSPKKTVEGAVGGVIGSIVLCLILGASIASVTLIDTGALIKFSLVTGLLGGVTAEIGDLFASSIKRWCGIKDFSQIIPGHGGILDRFDSALMVAPLVMVMLGIFNMV